jgi:hypothetical protein
VSSWIHEWLSGWAATPDVTLDLVAGVAIANGEELTAFAVVEASGSEAWGSVRRRHDAALQLDAGDVLANGEDVTVSGDAVLSSEAQSAAARAMSFRSLATRSCRSVTVERSRRRANWKRWEMQSSTSTLATLQRSRGWQTSPENIGSRCSSSLARRTSCRSE